MSISEAARRAAGCVSEERLWRRLMAMAEIGGFAGGGVNRQALSDEDIRARALLLEWAGARGYHASVDDIANLFLTREGRDADAAPVLAGSHMDSQPAGGRFDGIYGVLAAFEALEALDEAGIATDRPVEVVAWTNEEGGRFSPGAMGSAVFSGERRLEEFLDVADAAGVRFGDALAATLAAMPKATRRQLEYPIAAYIEPHIEQGPRLEAEGAPIGVVTGIQGARWYVVEVAGEPAHAGTAPLRGRKDALRAAVAMIARLQELTADPADVVRFTVGRMAVEPNSPNTVPGKATFSIDLRHPAADVLARLDAGIESACRGLAGGCEVRIHRTFEREPVVFADVIVRNIEAAASGLGLGHLRLPSGAFHDANFIADLCPTGMIFVPCARGVSHSPKEDAAPGDLAAGARVLAATLVELTGTSS
ncbi:MAG TPA: Zn-dependent hydrolase [Geminicoccaceae bacterium]